MKRYAFYLFLLCFLIYNLNANTTIKGDTTPARLLPFTILSGRGIYLDDFVSLFKEVPYFFSPFRGHYISSYSMLVGLVSLPFYLPTFLYLKAQGSITPGILYKYSLGLEKFSASFLAALSVALFALLMYSLTHKKHTSVLWALVFGLATQTYSVSSQYLWQHGLANLWLIVSQLALVRGLAAGKPKTRFLTISLAFGVLAIWARSAFLAYTLPLAFTLIFLDRKHWQRYASIVVFGVSVLIAYYQYFYGTWFSSAATPATDFNLRNISSALVGLFFSPARGLLFYTPFFLVSFLSFIYYAKLRALSVGERAVLRLQYIFLIAITGIYATYAMWWTGWGWGDRYFTDVAPGAVILTYYIYIFCKRKLVKLTIVALVAYTFLTQLIGVFFYPRGQWDNYPVSVGAAQNRLWEMKDNPLVRNLVVGPDLSVIYRFFYTLTGRASSVYLGKNRQCALKLVGKQDLLGYRVAVVALQNLSPGEWVASGSYPLELRQFYAEPDGSLLVSPVPSSQLPAVVKSGQSISVRVPLIPPDGDSSRVIVTPVQQGVLSWLDFCALAIQL